MGKLIAIKLDVSKIDKARLFAGQKGTYLDLTVSLNDQDDAYGNNVACWQGQSKEEREAKVNRNFLGNGKVVYSSDAQPQQQQQPQQQYQQPQQNGFPQQQQQQAPQQFGQPQQQQPMQPNGLPVEDELPF